MTDSNPMGNGSGGAVMRDFVLQQVYVKDLSFESPNTPAVFNDTAQPNVNLSLRSAHNLVAPDIYEVVLHLSAHAKVTSTTEGERSMYLVELDQAGLFKISGYSAEETSAILGIHCPTNLLPYAREVISSLVSKGGFPALVLQPLNFEAIYGQSARNAASA